MLTKLQSHPLVTHATMRNIKHPTTVDRCYYTHTHTPSLTAVHTTICLRKPAAHIQYRNKFSHTPPQHLVPSNLCVKSIFYRATLPWWESISCVFLSIRRFERNLAGIQWFRHLHLVPKLQVTGLWDGPGCWDMQDWSSAVYGFRQSRFHFGGYQDGWHFLFLLS